MERPSGHIDRDKFEEIVCANPECDETCFLHVEQLQARPETVLAFCGGRCAEAWLNLYVTGPYPTLNLIVAFSSIV